MDLKCFKQGLMCIVDAVSDGGPQISMAGRFTGL